MRGEEDVEEAYEGGLPHMTACHHKDKNGQILEIQVILQTLFTTYINIKNKHVQNIRSWIKATELWKNSNISLLVKIDQ